MMLLVTMTDDEDVDDIDDDYVISVITSAFTLSPSSSFESESSK